MSSTSKKLSTDERAELEALRSKVAALEAKNAPKVSALKITEKGGLSVYGLQRFPVTLYAAQWLALLGEAQKITGFISEHKAELAFKRPSETTTASGAVAVKL